MPPFTPEDAAAAGAPGLAPADRWIESLRGERHPVDPWLPVAAFLERERTETGDVAPIATILLANRECPWKCLMCDLWKNTTVGPTPPGAVPRQIRGALARWPDVRRVKLYNAGSFFDPRAVPPDDLPEIARILRGFERVVVECHPALVGETCRRFAGSLDGVLEIAIGLETVHPDVLPRLNKRMTLEDFENAARRLASFGAALRAFVLLGLPWSDPAEAADWAVRSAAFAFDAGATVVSIVPTRPGNGALDALAERGEFTAPSLADLEEAADRGIALGGGRLFADLWELDRLRRCEACFEARRARLEEGNQRQEVPPRVSCALCGPGRAA